MITRRDWMRSMALGIAGTMTSGVACAVPAPVPPPRVSAGDRLESNCRGSLVLGLRVMDGAELMRIGQWCQQQGAVADLYGEGDFVASFEKKVAAILGFDAACFMPTGTMAQLCMLRLYAEQGRGRGVGVHPSSHHVLHEDSAMETLHAMHAVIVSPWNRAMRGDDVRAVREPLAAVSVELPVRWTGQLQTWGELEDLKTACRERGIPLHLDGARLWECAPAYGRSYAEICRGCSSVYVSLYKTIGALGGAVVVGSKELVRGARLWRHRQGGEIFQFFPYVASAAMRFDETLARIPAWVARAQRLAARLAKDPRLVVSPTAPQTNLFHVYFKGEPETVKERRDRIAREQRIWVTHGVGRARVPGYVDVELHLSARSDALSDEEAAKAVLALVA